MSSATSTATLAAWDPIDLLSLLNPSKLAITCVGYAPSCRRRCRNHIAAHNISSAKVVMRELVRSDLFDDEVKNLLYELAEYLLCRRYHQGQATVVSDGWWRLVQAQREGEEDGGSDTSDDGEGDSDDDDGGSSDGSDGDSDDGGSGRRNREAHRNDNSLRYRIDEQEARLEAEQFRREDAYLLAQHEREEARERSRRATAEAEIARREEALRQAARERAQREAEAERLRQEEAAAAAAAAAAENARQERERQQNEQRQKTRAQMWDDAWSRYEKAWSQISPDNRLSELDVLQSSIWPTKTGSYSSCSESDVKLFFISQPGSVSRNVIRRQALRWHPDRAVRLFGHVKDESQLRELMKAVTMISQVVIGIMAIASR